MNRNHVWYGLAVVLNLGLAQFGIELASGNVPIPQTLTWVVPIAVAMITGLTTLLPALRGSRHG